jgi:hypothetical protein
MPNARRLLPIDLHQAGQNQTVQVVQMIRFILHIRFRWSILVSMNNTTGAQRHNKRQDAIWEKAKAIEAAKKELPAFKVVYDDGSSYVTSI